MSPLIKLACLLIAITWCAIGAAAQNKHRFDNASKDFDVELNIGPCDENRTCRPLVATFFRKHAKLPFQTIRLPQTAMWDDEPKANATKLYDDQGVINFEDFNFDGVDDVAISDGADGSYGSPTYRVYIYSPIRKRFAFSRPFTRMNDGGLGMFETDTAKKIHYVFSKSGCCWHRTEGFDVYRGLPRKVYQATDDSAYGDGTKVRTVVRKLVKGRWRTTVRYEKLPEEKTQP